MGYTHYWEQHADIPKKKWNKIILEVAQLFELAEAEGIEIASGCGTSKEFELNENIIRFNGFQNESYETFSISRVLDTEEYHAWEGFNFCKTARLPYDKVVLAVLMAIDAEVGNKQLFSWSSDGEAARGDFDEATKMIESLTVKG